MEIVNHQLSSHSGPACTSRRSSACSALLQMLARAACPCAPESPVRGALLRTFHAFADVSDVPVK